MEDTILPILLTSLTSLVCPLIIFVACSYYISKQVKAVSILLFISSGCSLLLTGVYSVVMPYLIQKRNLNISDLTSYYAIGGVLGLIFGLCFASGIFILIYKTVNENKVVFHQFPPSND